MKKYARNAIILVEPHTTVYTDLVVAKSKYDRCGTRSVAIGPFLFVPSNRYLRINNTISSQGCWNNALMGICVVARFYDFMWLPVMGLFCRIKVDPDAKIRT